MKKLFLALAISAFFVACNDATTTTESTTDSTMAPATPMVSAPDSAAMPMMDSTTMKTATDSSAK